MSIEFMKWLTYFKKNEYDIHNADYIIIFKHVLIVYFNEIKKIANFDNTYQSIDEDMSIETLCRHILDLCYVVVNRYGEQMDLMFFENSIYYLDICDEIKSNKKLYENLKLLIAISDKINILLIILQSKDINIFI